MTNTKRRLIDLDDLTVADLLQIEEAKSERLPKKSPTPKTGITAETIKALLKEK